MLTEYGSYTINQMEVRKLESWCWLIQHLFSFLTPTIHSFYFGMLHFPYMMLLDIDIANENGERLFNEVGRENSHEFCYLSLSGKPEIMW